MKSPVSLLSASHPSTLVATTHLSASHLIRSAMEKWTVQTARMKDPSAVMFVLHVISFCFVLLQDAENDTSSRLHGLVITHM